MSTHPGYARGLNGEADLRDSLVLFLDLFGVSALAMSPTAASSFRALEGANKQVRVRTRPDWGYSATPACI